MTAVTNELMYEILKSIQGEVRMVRETQGEMRRELAALRGHFVAMSTDIANIYSRLGAVEDQVGRVEKRLGLVDIELN